MDWRQAFNTIVDGSNPYFFLQSFDQVVHLAKAPGQKISHPVKF
jgi:hypothetical protein